MKLKPTALAMFMACTATVSLAQTFPTQPVKLVVPFPAGGGTDVLARSITDKLAARLGQPVVVDNRAGASGNIGADYVAKSNPDGHTLLMAATMVATYKLTYAKLPFDALTDLVGIGTVAETPNVLVVHPTSPIRNLQQLATAARAKPGGLNYGTAGLGSPQHLGTEQLARLGNFKLQHVAYKGTAPAVIDVMGNQIDIASISLTAVMPQIEGKKVHPVAVLSAKRTSLAPDIPTAAESGIAGIDSSVRFLLMVPAKTPPAVVAKLNAELNQVLADPAVKQAFAKAGYDAYPSTPAESTAMVKKEFEVLGPVINSLNLEKQ
jgi:tripartite-type tricarboxylate transporter receptor subunit TctC